MVQPNRWTTRCNTPLDDSSLERLCELARDKHVEEYTHLDLLLGVRAIILTTDQPLMASVTQVSWEKALRVFDARLATVSVEHGAKLQHWKEAVAEVYSDFATKLPNAELPTLVVRAALEDGRKRGQTCNDGCLCFDRPFSAPI